jgi:RNA-directed DNA polymerase
VVDLFTEGKTDVLHLRAALAAFHERGDFPGLQLRFPVPGGLGSDSNLRKHLDGLPASQPTTPSVCLFDRDNERLLNELNLRQQDWSDRGNGVAAASIVTPTGRSEPLCIEMLYPDSDLLRPTAEGRRIYLRSEFDPRTGHHISENCSVADRKRDSLVRDDVYEFGTQRSLSLPKADFAQAVYERAAPFSKMGFEGFRPTFEMLEAVLKQVEAKVRAT